MIVAIVAGLGLIVGSFLNAAIHRLHSGQSIIKDRSRCPHCGHLLGFIDLIPVISFFYLGGRCAYCHKKISWQYPAIEIITAITFVLLAFNYGLRVTDYGFWLQMVFICLLIVIGVFDFKHFLILDKLVFPALVIAVVASVLRGTLVDSLVGSLLVSIFFAIQYFVSKGRWIGFGDVKFGLFLGALLGVKAGLAMLLLAYILGSITGLGLIAFGRKSLGSKLPFGSFLSVSAIITMLYGDLLVEWYLNLIGIGR
jgi:prepilin signal peptidase PulO-like enzyme (type II secretory pathway)